MNRTGTARRGGYKIKVEVCKTILAKLEKRKK